MAMIYRLLCLVTALLCAAGCGGRDFIRDSAELDRALVPVIDFTGHGEFEYARMAMAELLPAWQEFSARVREHRPGDGEWSAALAEIDTLLADVAELLEEDGDLDFAAANLVDMRMMLAELREEAGIEYLPDLLGEFWEPVEELDLLARRRRDEGAQPGDDVSLSVLFEEYDALLQDLVEARFEPARYGFDRPRTAAFLAGLDALADAGEELELALDASDLDRMLVVAGRLRPLFFDIYRLFGDYDIAPLDEAEDN